MSRFNTEGVIFCIVVGVALCIGYLAGKQDKAVVLPSLTYSTTQIDDLIKHSIILTNIIAEQLQYEKSITK